MPIIFNEADRGILRSKCQLSDDAINELEQMVAFKKARIDHSNIRPTAKAERVAVKNLRSSISKLSRELNQLNPFIEDKLEYETPCYEFGRAKERILKDLDLVDSIITKVKLPIGKVGNKQIDDQLVNLVRTVALLMQEHGITPKKLGKHFRNTVGVVFRTIGEDESTIKTIVDNHWPEIEEDLETAIDFPHGDPADFEEYLKEHWNRLTPAQREKYWKDHQYCLEYVKKQKKDQRV